MQTAKKIVFEVCVCIQINEWFVIFGLTKIKFPDVLDLILTFCVIGTEDKQVELGMNLPNPAKVE